ncbi:MULTISPECIES: methyltransferase domain-containing protein [Burkholderia]|uniref:methyltransferase domain-containing protein n=1 Tax=Burkholderia TaxID=32008 RepID=UPI00075939A9|nr:MULTISPECIES: methyltransferase domain-containing protein [Burkholderia]AOJ83721.1 methyltransferase [Burkholderia savannae]KVK83422.1 methyltransferase [Burkholderia sp. MSMB1498]KWZ47705.1 methyltransferase [Burkholderia savannae]
MQTHPDGLSSQYEAQRYSNARNILRSEIIYGDGFQSPGGIEGFRTMLADKMPIEPGMHLLDVGSGLGGAAFHLASRYDVTVVGLDTAPRMTELAAARQPALDPRGRVRFVNGDIHGDALAGERFDIVYSRDALMYVHDKASLFARCHALLAPQGRLYITDFCRGRASLAFDAYVSVSGYDLRTIDEYARIVEDAGFDVLTATDVSDDARRQLTDDLHRYEARVASRDPSIDAPDAEHIVERWRRKIRFVDEGSLLQGLFVAQRR